MDAILGVGVSCHFRTPWYWTVSNRRRQALQACALPTELQYRIHTLFYPTTGVVAVPFRVRNKPLRYYKLLPLLEQMVNLGVITTFISTIESYSTSLHVWHTSLMSNYI